MKSLFIMCARNISHVKKFHWLLLQSVFIYKSAPPHEFFIFINLKIPFLQLRFLSILFEYPFSSFLVEEKNGSHYLGEMASWSYYLKKFLFYLFLIFFRKERTWTNHKLTFDETNCKNYSRYGERRKEDWCSSKALCATWCTSIFWLRLIWENEITPSSQPQFLASSMKKEASKISTATSFSSRTTSRQSVSTRILVKFKEEILFKPLHICLQSLHLVTSRDKR